MRSANRNYLEKRGFIRMKIDTPAHVSLQDANASYTGLCRDLSGGGMLVELDSILPIGAELDVNITSVHGHAPMLSARAVVTRVESQPSASDSSCLLGLEITELVS